MSHLGKMYSGSLALLTDLYEITMAYGFWKEGMADRRAAFHLFFRKNPFEGGYTIACGLETVLDYLEAFRFTPDDLLYLSTLKGADGKDLLGHDFLKALGTLTLDVDVDAVPEGTAVFPHEPLVRVTGPIMACQILESALLNIINFQSLVATKAARICSAARGDAVLEFGLRRAQGIDGALSASRAAYVGGAAATSNVLAGKLFGIPVGGTHAHSWVLAFDTELQAFDAFARHLPNNAVLLVDTYGTIEGIENAIRAGRKLEQRGGKLLGVRIDSGDLAYLSKMARKMLDEAGFRDAKVYASNELDEEVIESLKNQGAAIAVWGVGTKLATAFSQPALGGVYKLTAIDDPKGAWQPKLKVSEQSLKINNPGVQQIRRFRDGAEFAGDMVFDVRMEPKTENVHGKPKWVIHDPFDATRRKSIEPGTPYEDLLVPVLRGGKRVYQTPPLAEIRERTRLQLAGLHEGIRRFVNAHRYPVGLDRQLHDLRASLVLDARGGGKER